jgi:hypothetical protein
MAIDKDLELFFSPVILNLSALPIGRQAKGRFKSWQEDNTKTGL